MKVAFVTDSGTGKSIHEYAEQGIISLPLQISVDDTTYQDMETLNRNDCIRLMKEGQLPNHLQVLLKNVLRVSRHKVLN